MEKIERISFYQKFLQVLDSSFIFRLIFTLFVSFLAIAIKYYFFPPFEIPYLFAMLAITISALYAGFAGGIISAVITVIFVNYLFFSPQFTFKLTHNSVLYSIVFIFQGLLISFLIERERTMRKKIYHQAEQFQVTLSSIGDAVITTDIKGQITFMNKVAEDLTGWNSCDAVGKKLESIFNIINAKTKKKALNPVKKVIVKNKIVGLENHTVLIKKNGNTIPIDDSAAPINDSFGNLIGVVLVFRDVTQARILEQRKDDFVSIVSHELKTPVTSLKLFAQVLKRKFQKNNDDESLNIIEKINCQLNNITELISDFLDLSRIQSGKLYYRKEKVIIDNLIKETVKDLQQIYIYHDILLKGEIGEKLLIDQDRIKQVIINLISNAVKYSNHKKEIIIKLEKNKEYAIIKVQDFGAGIPKDHQSKIFNRFYQVTTKKSKTFPGLGLGLYISSEIIKGHNGKILVESKVGKGSTFQFLLPFLRIQSRTNN